MTLRYRFCSFAVKFFEKLDHAELLSLTIVYFCHKSSSLFIFSDVLYFQINHEEICFFVISNNCGGKIW